MAKIDELYDDGFTIIPETPKTSRFAKKPKAKKKPVAPVIAPKIEVPAPTVVVDNSELIQFIGHTNDKLQRCVENLLDRMEKKPSNFSLDIKRDHLGNIAKINVTVNRN